MESAFQAPPVHYTPYYPSYNYEPQVTMPSLPSDYFVLDLSRKSTQRVPSDYNIYPSPKSSPASTTSHDEFGCSGCGLQSSLIKEEPIDPEFHSPPYASSPEEPRNFSPLSYPQSSSRNTASPSETSETSETSSQCNSRPAKIQRPFKCIGKDPLTLPLDVIDRLSSAYTTSSLILDDANLDSEEIKRLMEESSKKYAEFREKMLVQLRNNNNSINHNMRRVQNNGHKTNDPDYLEKRRKNNEAAKRSRDARKNKQDEHAIRATFLEQENIMLRLQLKAEQEDLERLRKMELERQTLL